ncbi:hypothetical protein [Halotia branconii]|uniref:Uncharacterized protein n=1 Tax=Halotia branconii CENA392 TaxID=1539056 RepID=A0AAJ6NS48_9CYAN|nr:hypothetical protein [Halotia branconii]WGV25729.1 hypothetical protein QI031_29085 [Halotia branconii CENA392]
MESSQKPQRHAAEHEFEESLDQLEDILQENLTEDEEVAKLPTSNVNKADLNQDLTAVDLDAFEDAVADIEKYLDEKTK